MVLSAVRIVIVSQMRYNASIVGLPGLTHTIVVSQQLNHLKCGKIMFMLNVYSEAGIVVDSVV